MTLAASAAHAGSANGLGSARPKRPVATPTYVVRPGDTLWGIARRIAGPRADLRPVVDELAGANHVRGTLRVGMRLVLPE